MNLLTRHIGLPNSNRLLCNNGCESTTNLYYHCKVIRSILFVEANFIIQRLNCLRAVDIIQRCVQSVKAPVLKFLIVAHEIWRARNSIIHSIAKEWNISRIISTCTRRFNLYCYSLQTMKEFDRSSVLTSTSSIDLLNTLPYSFLFAVDEGFKNGHAYWGTFSLQMDTHMQELEMQKN